jgi:phospholipid/cholesterol/gamma-HCH transport system permease protein
VEEVHRSPALMTAPTLSFRSDTDSPRLAAAGSWTARHTAELEALVRERQQDRVSPGAATIDLAGVSELDTFGACFLEKLSRARGDAAFAGVPARFQNLLLEVKQTNRRVRPVQSRRPWLLSRIELFGRRAAEIGREFLLLVATLGEIANAIPRAAMRSRTVISAAHHLDRVAWQAVPIILLITFLIGGIIAQQGIFHFRKFGADD